MVNGIPQTSYFVHCRSSGRAYSLAFDGASSRISAQWTRQAAGAPQSQSSDRREEATSVELSAVSIFVVAIGVLTAQTGARGTSTPQLQREQDQTAIRSLLAESFEDNWNNHQPTAAVAPDKCIDDAIFINTTGGWVKGREKFAQMIAPLHAPEGPFPRSHKTP